MNMFIILATSNWPSNEPIWIINLLGPINYDLILFIINIGTNLFKATHSTISFGSTWSIVCSQKFVWGISWTSLNLFIIIFELGLYCTIPDIVDPF